MYGWTPVDFRADPEPRLEWADLTAQRFDGPPFRHIVDRWRIQAPVPTHWTGLSAVEELDATPSLDPTLIITHAARCGSTLLARQMAALDGCILVLEPGILARLLTSAIDKSAGYPAPQILRWAVRGLGRVRFGDERGYVLKLGSTLTRFLPLFQRAFPGVPIAWLQRQPAEIAASELRSPGRSLAPLPAEREELAAAILRQLTVTFLAATAHVDEQMLVLDYRDLPEAAWLNVMPFIGAAPTAAELGRMQAIARYDSKSGEPFQVRPPEGLPAAIQARVKQTLDPLYATLDRVRTGGGA